jgi:type I restriction enzyme S subunit
LLLGEDGVQFLDPHKQKAYLISGPAWVNNHAHVLRVHEQFCSRDYLCHYLNSAQYQGFVGGSTRLKLTQADMRRLPISLPPLAEQRRIVEALDDHLSRLDAALSVLDAGPLRIKRLQDAILTKAFNGSLVLDDLSDGDASILVRDSAHQGDSLWNIPDAWRWQKIGSLFDVYVGATPSRANPDFWNGDVPWVSSGEVSFSRINHTREHITTEAVGNRRTRLHPPGTVMIAMIGEGRTRGQAAILDIDAAHNQNCASIRVSETKVPPEYVYWYLVYRYEQNRREASGGNQTALNKDAVRNISIPIAPLASQRAIVFAVEDLTSHLRIVDEAFSAARKRGELLRSALISQAMHGDLVPQNSDDEPASILLDQIRKSRTASSPRNLRQRSATHAAAPRSTTAIPVGVQEELPL